MKVTMIGSTAFHRFDAEGSTDNRWIADTDAAFGRQDASLLSEFAGRECYQSWDKPNPATATNEGYLRNIIRQQHTSVLEHGVVSFRIEGVSRSLTHELVRHRHFSYSQLSQRYVDVLPEFPVLPPFWRDREGELGEETRKMLCAVWTAAVDLYNGMVQAAESCGATRKEARQSARYVLPNMTPTSLVMTGNHLAWRQMLIKRGSAHADAEIRELACEIFRQLKDLEPSLYQDMADL